MHMANDNKCLLNARTHVGTSKTSVVPVFKKANIFEKFHIIKLYKQK